MLLGADPADLTVLGVIGPEEVHLGSAHGLSVPIFLTLLSKLHVSHQQVDENQMSHTVLTC